VIPAAVLAQLPVVKRILDGLPPGASKSGCLLEQPKRLATASAMIECETMRIGKTEILRVLKDEPTFSKMFISHLLARNARVEEDATGINALRVFTLT